MQASLFHLIDDYLIISTSLFRKWIRREKKKTVIGQKLFDPVSPPCFQKHDKSVHCHLAISSFIIIFFPLNWAMEMRPFENSSTWSLQLYTLITNWKAFVFEHVGISFFFFLVLTCIRYLLLFLDIHNIYLNFSPLPYEQIFILYVLFFSLC